VIHELQHYKKIVPLRGCLEGKSDERIAPRVNACLTCEVTKARRAHLQFVGSELQILFGFRAVSPGRHRSY
jgi:hypothetical protein